MTIPDFQTLMLPVLRKAASGEAQIGVVVEDIARDFHLTSDERNELLPSGRQTTIANRVHWAKSYLKQAGLVTPTRRGHFTITDRGKAALGESPPRIDIEYLKRFPEFNAFRERSASEPNLEVVKPGLVFTPEIPLGPATPEDAMRVAHREINATLGREMLDRTLSAPPTFFERLIVQLLLAMGYGGSAANAGRAIGRAGDDGIDGVIDQDALGLDRVYIQAKRYKPDSGVGAGAIRDFFGSLDMHKASKGLFVTTSTFTTAARETAERLGKRIVLIDGQQLTQLMIRFGVGCRLEEVFELKRIDEEFFE